MVMRLLKKTEIDKRKAEDRKREIDEGMKLARRVDTLRQTAVEEEKNLVTFRTQTLTTITADIKVAEGKKTALEKEVRDLEKRKEIALAPLDEAWAAANAEKVRLEKEAKELTSYKEDLIAVRGELRSKQTMIDKEAEKQRLRGITLNENLEKSAIIKEQAKLALRESSISATNRAHDLNDRERGIVARETAVINRENAISMRDVEQDLRERALNERETRVRDREQMLIRTQKRLKK